ncbi:AT-rich interactive domain-containing protein 5-like [Forsythia ovata]|uniref:AT-rich interactive domain-containing protein 5-like n=1 Tax=Forsythia ovata TaxID=205694 RepID=A0ABD1UAL0_9LAMI
MPRQQETLRSAITKVKLNRSKPGALTPLPSVFPDLRMDKSDVEMEDIKKHLQDSVNNELETENELPDAKVECREGELPTTAAMDDVNAGANEAEDLKNTEGEAEDWSSGKNGAEHQINVNRETKDPIKSEAEDPINCESEADDPINSNSVAEDHTSTKYEVNEQYIIGSRVEEEKNSMENGIEGADHVENVMEEDKLTEDVMKEKTSNENGMEDGNPVESVGVEEKPTENAALEKISVEVSHQRPTELSANEAPPNESVLVDDMPQVKNEEMTDAVHENEGKAVKAELKEPCNEVVPATSLINGNAKSGETATKCEFGDASIPSQQRSVTPNSLVKFLPSKAVDHSGEMVKTVFSQTKLAEGDDGTPEDQTIFMKELESFHWEKGMDFKPPKFYGHPLNCLKLWRAVIKLGGYDRVTGSKLWRQVGESFHPPKTCTTVSWTFRIFYEKTLLEFERHKTQIGELQLPVATLPEVSGADNEGNGYQGSGRARRDAAARAMQGWHAQRLFGSGEVDEPTLKDKNLSTTAKREKNLKSMGPFKQKRPNEVELSVKAARTETSKQLVTTVVDVGPPADWVKINIRETEDSFEVYALVPGLLREEVRVQSDAAGRLVITGQPEQPDNPWGVTPFKKVVSLPARIDPAQTSAVVSLHGRLFVRVPFEQSTT